MLVAEAYAETQIALAVRSFEFGGDALLFVSREKNVSVKQSHIGNRSCRAKLYVDEFDNRQASEGFVGAFDIVGTVRLPGAEITHLVE